MFSFLLEDNVWVRTTFMFSWRLTDGSRLPSGCVLTHQRDSQTEMKQTMFWGYLHREKEDIPHSNGIIREHITHANSAVDTLPVLKWID